MILWMIIDILLLPISAANVKIGFALDVRSEVEIGLFFLRNLVEGYINFGNDQQRVPVQWTCHW